MKKTVLLLAMMVMVIASCSKLEHNEKKYLEGILNEDYNTSAQAMNDFIQWIKNEKATMNYDFPLMCEKLGMKVVESPDGKVRCLSWITSKNDSITNYANVTQWLLGEDYIVYDGPIDAMLTGRKPDVRFQWSQPHRIDTIYQIEGANVPIYLIEESYVNEVGMSFSYISAAVNSRLTLKILPFFFNGIETAGNRQYIDDGKVNKKDLIKWDAKAKKIYSYLTDENDHVIPGKYETFVLGEHQFTKVEEDNNNNTEENKNN